MTAVLVRTREWPVVADLAVGEGADQEITLAHVGQRSLDVERCAPNFADAVIDSFTRSRQR